MWYLSLSGKQKNKKLKHTRIQSSYPFSMGRNKKKQFQVRRGRKGRRGRGRGEGRVKRVGVECPLRNPTWTSKPLGRFRRARSTTTDSSAACKNVYFLVSSFIIYQFESIVKTKRYAKAKITRRYRV